jgi:hypothetical protein
MAGESKAKTTKACKGNPTFLLQCQIVSLFSAGPQGRVHPPAASAGQLAVSHCPPNRLRARAKKNRLGSHESIAEDLSAAENIDDRACHELRPVLDEEVSRLPRKYRDVIMSCYLQERTYSEAAKNLGLTAWIVSTRLARA